MSGYNAVAQPSFIQARYAAPATLADLPSGADRAYHIARCALTRRVSFAVSILPSGLTHLASVIDAHREELLRDIHDGTFHGAAPTDPSLLR